VVIVEVEVIGIIILVKVSILVVVVIVGAVPEVDFPIIAVVVFKVEVKAVAILSETMMIAVDHIVTVVVVAVVHIVELVVVLVVHQIMHHIKRKILIKNLTFSHYY